MSPGTGSLADARHPHHHPRHPHHHHPRRHLHTRPPAQRSGRRKGGTPARLRSAPPAAQEGGRSRRNTALAEEESSSHQVASRRSSSRSAAAAALPHEARSSACAPHAPTLSHTHPAAPTWKGGKSCCSYVAAAPPLGSTSQPYLQVRQGGRHSRGVGAARRTQVRSGVGSQQQTAEAWQKAWQKHSPCND